METRFTLCLAVLIYSIDADIFDSDATANETEYFEYSFNITKKLFSNYDSERRPVQNSSRPVNVYFFLGIYHIEAINEVEQSVTIHGFLSMHWRDEFLRWNRQDFNGQDTIDVPLYRIWKPDINIYNSASGKDDWTISRIYPARITYNGQVLMWPPVTFKVSCHFDFSDYPNDQQVCPLVFGSLKYSKELADYNWAPVAPLLSLSYRSFKRHISGWKVLSVSNKRYFWHENQRSNTTSDATTNFIEMMAFIKLQRFQPYFQILLVLPALACSVFTIFALNKQSGEIGLFILLMVLMIQGIFARSLIIKLPIGGATPRIVKYFGFNLAMTFIGIIATVIRMSLIQCTREVPGKLLFFVRLIINLQISLEAKLMICKAKSTQPLLVEENAKIEGNEVQTMEETDPIRLDRIQNWDLITKCYQIILTILYILVYLVISFAFLV